MDISNIFSEAFRLFSMMLPLLFIGFLLSNLLQANRYLEYTSIPMSSLAEIANLPRTCSSILTLFFFSSWSAMGMLSSFFRERILGERDVIVTVLIAQLPKGLHSTIFFQAPVALPVLGYEIGGTLLFLELLMFTGITVIGIFAGRTLLVKTPPNTGGGAVLKIPKTDETTSNRIIKARVILGESAREFWRVARVLIPTGIFFIIILDLGLEQYSAEILRPVMDCLDLPGSTVLVLGASLVSQIAVLSAAGTLIVKEQITALQCLEVLFIARALHLGVGYIKTTLPTNIALFGRSLGVKVTCVECFMVESGLTFIILLLIMKQIF